MKCTHGTDREYAHAIWATFFVYLMQVLGYPDCLFLAVRVCSFQQFVCRWHRIMSHELCYQLLYRCIYSLHWMSSGPLCSFGQTRSLGNCNGHFTTSPLRFHRHFAPRRRRTHAAFTMLHGFGLCKQLRDVSSLVDISLVTLPESTNFCWERQVQCRWCLQNVHDSSLPSYRDASSFSISVEIFSWKYS